LARYWVCSKDSNTFGDGSGFSLAKDFGDATAPPTICA
jgi:hypothetical protein